MQCPNCKYEPTLTELQGSPEQCPSCGVYYAKAAQQKAAPKDPWALEKKIIGKVSAGIAGARSVVDEARELRSADQDEREAIRRARAPVRGEVIVVDIDMPFWSMVKFMVKLALAAIPAAIIVAIIFAGFSAIISLIGR